MLSERLSRTPDSDSVEAKLHALRKKKKIDGTADQVTFFCIAALSASLIALQIEVGFREQDELNDLHQRIKALETELISIATDE